MRLVVPVNCVDTVNGERKVDGVIEQKPTEAAHSGDQDRREAKSLALREAILKETAYLKPRDQDLWRAGARFAINFLGAPNATTAK